MEKINLNFAIWMLANAIQNASHAQEQYSATSTSEWLNEAIDSAEQALNSLKNSLKHELHR